MKIGWVIFISVLVGLLVWLYMEYFYLPNKTVTIKSRDGYNLVLLRLPADHNPDVFGAPFWDARHTLAELTPCPSCRAEAVSHERFFHDYVNKKTEKKIMYQENFDKWIKEFCKPKYES